MLRMVPVCTVDEFTALVHGTRLIPGHRRVLLGPTPLQRVNHVPGLLCKGCFRFVPLTPSPLAGEGRGEGEMVLVPGVCEQPEERSLPWRG